MFLTVPTILTWTRIVAIPLLTSSEGCVGRTSCGRPPGIHVGSLERRQTPLERRRPSPLTQSQIRSAPFEADINTNTHASGVFAEDTEVPSSNKAAAAHTREFARIAC